MTALSGCSAPSTSLVIRTTFATGGRNRQAFDQSLEHATGIPNGENLVGDYFKEKGFKTERFLKSAKRQSRTPDFRVMAGGALGFYCEVKTAQRDEMMGLRGDPTYNLGALEKACSLNWPRLVSG